MCGVRSCLANAPEAAKLEKIDRVIAGARIEKLATRFALIETCEISCDVVLVFGTGPQHAEKLSTAFIGAPATIDVDRIPSPTSRKPPAGGAAIERLVFTR